MALPLSYNIRNLRERWKVTLLAIGAIALVVTVFVVLLSMANGFRIALGSTGSESNAIVTQQGSASELTSWLGINNAQLLSVDSRVARGKDGQPLASCEVFVLSSQPKRGDRQPTNVSIRGVQPRAFEVRQGIKIVQGRNFTPGLNEVVIGQRIADRIEGFDLGKSISMQRRDWKIVGIFSAEGGAFESEVWGDYNIMGPAFQRNGGCNTLTLTLQDPKSLGGFDKEVRANPQMQLQLTSEKKYYADQAGPVASALTGLAAFVAIIMGIGAIFGAMNTMYAIVASRTREIGTLRALGFSRFSILFSFVLESVFLAMVGGALGCLLSFPMNNYSTGTASGFSELAFAFQITPPTLIVGIVFAALMGIFGGLLPAFRAARMPITSALREA
jgi:putative ABC transport system permease protein